MIGSINNNSMDQCDRTNLQNQQTDQKIDYHHYTKFNYENIV